MITYDPPVGKQIGEGHVLTVSIGGKVSGWIRLTIGTGYHYLPKGGMPGEIFDAPKPPEKFEEYMLVVSV